MFTFKNEKELDEFELTGLFLQKAIQIILKLNVNNVSLGSTYEPIGELFHSGSRAKSTEYTALEEIATIAVMCNDSAIDFNEYKQAFEKVGEATEAALIVLAEKVNPYGIEKRGGRLESAKVVRKVKILFLLKLFLLEQK